MQRARQTRRRARGGGIRDIGVGIPGKYKITSEQEVKMNGSTVTKVGLYASHSRLVRH